MSPMQSTEAVRDTVNASRAKAAELSSELRGSADPAVERRRKVVALSLVAAGSMGLIALYQMGIIKHLAEPPLPRLNADKVDASAEAYEKLSTPDAVLGLGSYAATMTLAARAAPIERRSSPGSRSRWPPRRPSTSRRPASSRWTSGRSTKPSASGASSPPARRSPRCR